MAAAASSAIILYRFATAGTAVQRPAATVGPDIEAAS